MVKNMPANAGDLGLISGLGRFLGRGNGNPYSGILAWEIPWTEESGGLQIKGSQRVGHNSMTEQQQTAPTKCCVFFFFFFLMQWFLGSVPATTELQFQERPERKCFVIAIVFPVPQ